MPRIVDLAQQRDATTDELRAELERLLGHQLGWPCRIASLRRTASPYASSHRMENIDVALDDGSRLALIVKATGLCGMLDGARRTRPAFLQHPTREADLYRTVLHAVGASAPLSYGVVEPAEDRPRMFVLERIDGLELRRVGDFSVWKRAAFELATIQARLARHLGRRPAGDAPPLVKHHAASYWRWLERAVGSVSPDNPGGSRAAERSIRRLAAGYEQVVERLESLARMVIHGDCFASNVLVAGLEAQRICFVDWELAGCGPGLIDLAALVSGSWSAPEREDLLAAYREGLLVEGERVQSLDEMTVSLAACRLQLAIQMLGWSTDWQPPSEQRQDWLREALELAGELGL